MFLALICSPLRTYFLTHSPDNRIYVVKPTVETLLLFHPFLCTFPHIQRNGSKSLIILQKFSNNRQDCDRLNLLYIVEKRYHELKRMEGRVWEWGEQRLSTKMARWSTLRRKLPFGLILRILYQWAPATSRW